MTAEENYHAVLAKSYIVYFIFSVAGLFADTLISFHFTIPHAMIWAVLCFAVGPLIILWAQHTSRHTGSLDAETEQKKYFYRGPYKYIRNPTQLGLVILVAGYMLISNSFIFFCVTVLAYVVSNIYFRKYESILENTYGEQYMQYKTKVKKVL